MYIINPSLTDNSDNQVMLCFQSKIVLVLKKQGFLFNGLYIAENVLIKSRFYLLYLRCV